MQELRQDMRALRQSAGASLAETARLFCEALRRHPEAHAALAGRYRLQTTDTGFHLAFSLSEDGFLPLEETEPADVTVLGTEKELLRLIRGQSNPGRALLLGRLKVRGDLTALQKFAQILE